MFYLHLDSFWDTNKLKGTVNKHENANSTQVINITHLQDNAQESHTINGVIHN